MNPVYEEPWVAVPAEQCLWYHTMRFPDGEEIQGSWTIPDFLNYIGGYDISGKTLLDVGTASGYLAFNAERLGAQVTGLDSANTHAFRTVPFHDSLSFQNITASRERWNRENLIPMKNSWWYSWHKYQSKNKCIYAPLTDLYEWDCKFDIVMAGAVIEHLSDPVYTIGAWARIAKEAVLIPFTDIADGDGLYMRPMTPWSDKNFNYAWWQLSEGLYRKVFDNLGFDMHYKIANAQHNHDPSGPVMAQRPSIIAIRRK